MGLLSRWTPFRRNVIAVVPQDSKVVGRATINEEADLTLLEFDDQVELLWVDMKLEDAETFAFPSLEAAKAFAADRFGVARGDWS